ncbi:ArsR/SmtB family transcription factor [Streptomyces sp. NPDC006602]|uniref:ArsR/SmtB family transcription factor n=1 Tax=Streptomyces sp. NPDC006602 TaxID=3364751 RepID=UPI00367CA644
MTQDRAPDHVVLDAKSLRALAHPDRVEMLTLLRRNGPSTATRMAEQLGINSGSASYHLRQLAQAGLVAEDADRGNARERWWRSVHDGTVFDDLELARQEPEASLAYLQSVVNSYQLHIQQVLTTLPALPKEWQGAINASNWQLVLTPDQAHQLRQDMAEVVERYRLPEGVEAPNDGATVEVISYVLPTWEAKP